MEINLTPKKYLTAPEVFKLRNRLKDDLTGKALMIELLMTYGMRSGELLDLRLKDLNFDERTVEIRGTKGSRDRCFPINRPDLWKRLIKASEKCKSDLDRVFPISRFQLMRIWGKYKPCVSKTLHSLRHTAAIRLYQQTKDIHVVQNVLGHKQLSSTLIYQQYVYGVEKFKEIF